MFEIDNVFWVVDDRGISTLNNQAYEFPSNKKYQWCTTCRVGKSILVVSKEHCDDDDDGEISLFNPINKQWSNAKIKIKREEFAVVYYLN